MGSGMLYPGVGLIAERMPLRHRKLAARRDLTRQH